MLVLSRNHGNTGRRLVVRASDLLESEERNKFQCRAEIGYHVILSDVATVVVNSDYSGETGLFIGYLNDTTA